MLTLSEKVLDPGKYSVLWNPYENLPKGHYFISILINQSKFTTLKLLDNKFF